MFHSFYYIATIYFFFSFSPADTYMALDRKPEIHYFTFIIHMISYWSQRAVMEKVGANCKMLAAMKTTENTIGEFSL